MANKTAVVTGASSPAGRLLLKGLATRDDLKVVGVYSSVARVSDSSDVPARTLVCDLTQPLNPQAEHAIAEADVVYHFAWVRGFEQAEVIARNQAMIDHLLKTMPDPARFVLISTAAAGPSAPSVYGAAKFAVEQLVRGHGGTVLAVGLITSDPPFGAFAAIHRMVCGLPLRFHFDHGFRFYACSEDDFVAACLVFCEDMPAGDYAAFPPRGEGARTFLGKIEQRCTRVRLPLWLPSQIVLGAIIALRRVGLLPRGPSEKLMGFLYADQDGLAKRHQLPAHGQQGA